MMHSRERVRNITGEDEGRGANGDARLIAHETAFSDDDFDLLRAAGGRDLFFAEFGQDFVAAVNWREQIERLENV